MDPPSITEAAAKLRAIRPYHLDSNCCNRSICIHYIYVPTRTQNARRDANVRCHPPRSPSRSGQRQARLALQSPATSPPGDWFFTRPRVIVYKFCTRPKSSVVLIPCEENPVTTRVRQMLKSSPLDNFQHLQFRTLLSETPSYPFLKLELTRRYPPVLTRAGTLSTHQLITLQKRVLRSMRAQRPTTLSPYHR